MLCYQRFIMIGLTNEHIMILTNYTWCLKASSVQGINYTAFHQHFGSAVTQNQQLVCVCATAYLHAACVSAAPRQHDYLNAKDTVDESNITTS